MKKWIKYVVDWHYKSIETIYNYIFNFIRSAFFWFCNDERGKVKLLNPEYGVGDIAKELGKKWSGADPETKSKYEAMAEKDKARYERVIYNQKYLIFNETVLIKRFFSSCLSIIIIKIWQIEIQNIISKNIEIKL